ncbi:MAG: hypothetical protein ACK2U3_16495 [Anaerolineales bacterium]
MLVKQLASPAYNKGAMIVSKIRTKLPDRNEILPVFSTVLFFVFTWALYIIIFYLPSWLGEMTAWDILTTTVYLLYFALFESFIVTCTIVMLCFLLPASFFKNSFIPQGFSLVTLASLAAIMLHPRLNDLLSLDLQTLTILLISMLAGTLFLIILLSFIYKHLPSLKRTVTALAEKMTIFAYIYLPLGLLSLVAVIFKILF